MTSLVLVASRVVLLLFFLNTLSNAAPECEITISGSIGDANSTVEDVLNINKIILPKLEEIIKRDYFRIFQVNLYQKCQFWPDDGRCVLRDCQVEDCSISEIPIGLRESSYDKLISPKAVARVDSESGFNREQCSHEEEETLTLGQLDTFLDENQQKTIGKWSTKEAEDKPFCELGDESEQGTIYVDLLKNVEKYTGYKGESSARIWKSIYLENCFRSNPMRVFNGIPYSPVDTKACKEKRLFYRLISGLQTSISLQLCYNHLLSDFKSASSFFSLPKENVWGPSVEEFVRRFHPALVPESLGRLRNLFLAYVVEMRAIAKVAPYLRQQAFYTGNAAIDTQTRSMVLDFLRDIEDHNGVFDESQLFHEPGKEILDLKEEFRLRFLNISRIMDCVGCDKCRLWGKLQIQGIGTALKVLFNDNLFDNSKCCFAQMRPNNQLRRSEIVSLFNGFAKFATSIQNFAQLREMMIKQTSLMLRSSCLLCLPMHWPPLYRIVESICVDLYPSP
ncbi:Endoplasmic reticulum oxidoreductin 1 [Echinococcus multilocularis]|uniref:Endoplasmic reticulum oxidoreductin 1 n=1 Tax=Echinococcus multilocularis TaxID=6211 RepID=A0A087W1W7_ECHMU|nr:Endoplasmic reticulum oxidoreductin 1 [Echinococcus multilocularis]